MLQIKFSKSKRKYSCISTPPLRRSKAELGKELPYGLVYSFSLERGDEFLVREVNCITSPGSDVKLRLEFWKWRWHIHWTGRLNRLVWFKIRFGLKFCRMQFCVLVSLSASNDALAKVIISFSICLLHTSREEWVETKSLSCHAGKETKKRIKDIEVSKSRLKPRTGW